MIFTEFVKVEVLWKDNVRCLRRRAEWFKFLRAGKEWEDSPRLRRKRGPLDLQQAWAFPLAEAPLQGWLRGPSGEADLTHVGHGRCWAGRNRGVPRGISGLCYWSNVVLLWKSPRILTNSGRRWQLNNAWSWIFNPFRGGWELRVRIK